MSDLDYLIEGLKLCHDAKDTAELADIICDIQQLDFLRQQGNAVELDSFINGIVWKYSQKAAEHDKGLPQSQSTGQRAISCRRFLVNLGMENLGRKAVGKLGEEAINHLGRNRNVYYPLQTKARRFDCKDQGHLHLYRRRAAGRERRKPAL